MLDYRGACLSLQLRSLFSETLYSCKAIQVYHMYQQLQELSFIPPLSAQITISSMTYCPYLTLPCELTPLNSLDYSLGAFEFVACQGEDPPRYSLPSSPVFHALRCNAETATCLKTPSVMFAGVL
jgi:hypothetical protein